MVRPMLVAVVPAVDAEALRRELHVRGLIDRSVKMTKRGGEVLIPLRGMPPLDISSFGARVEVVGQLDSRALRRGPQVLMEERFSKAGIPDAARPTKWESLGDIAVLHLSDAARTYGEEIGRILGETLRARTVVEQVAPIHGPFRTPQVRVLWGDGTETVHIEGGVRYKLDVARVMFSSGNLAERLSIADRIRPGDVVVDLFAGIGYFSLPIAVRSKAKAVYACEVNRVAFDYLAENVRLNRVSNVVPLLGDCRDTAPHGIADWVLMGHFDAREYLDVAFRALRKSGTIVYHEVCPREEYPEGPVGRVSDAARAHWLHVVHARSRIVKSYAPGIMHVVVEARVQPQMRRSTP